MTQLWCCHVKGPGDILAAPDEATAREWAKSINTIGPELCAEAAAWPYSEASHAKHLPEAIADMTPRARI